MAMPHHVRPIIETGSFQGFVVQPKAESADKVKGTLRRSTQPRHIPGVRRDFGFDEDNVIHSSAVLKGITTTLWGRLDFSPRIDPQRGECRDDLAASTDREKDRPGMIGKR